jgi:SynChlorMet cassette radical SAM/SPASM protein ScmF
MRDKSIKLPEGCPRLNSYYIYLTGGCNLACKHCWLSPSFQPDGSTGGHLDYKLFVKAIEEGIPLGLNHVKLTGGEPLLHPDFTRIVAFLKEKNISATMETNGTLLTKSLARFLKEKSSLTFIAVSIDGANPETHDNFRGVKGSFKKACQAVRYLVEAGYRPQIIMCIYEGNFNEMEDMVHLAEKLGAGSIKFNLVQPTGRGELMTERGEVLDIHKLIELGKWVEGELQKQTSIRLHYSWPMAFYSLRRLQTFNSYSCGIFNILGILHTGHLAMCGIGAHVPELCYGLLGEDNIYEVWTTNQLLINLRKKLPAELEGICRECIFRNSCIGTCVAENYHLSRSLTAPYWFCQMAQEAGFFPVSRLRLTHIKKFSATNKSIYPLNISIKTKKKRRQLNEV